MPESPSLTKLFDLTGRVAIVSGGAGLLGSHISHGLAECGATLAIVSRDESRNKQFAAMLSDRYGVKALGIGADLRDASSLTAAVSKTLDSFGAINILVNCSGFGRKNSWESISEQDWVDDVDVSLHGPFRFVKAAFPSLKENRGVILNIASMYGVVAPDPRIYAGDQVANPPSYGASKAGILQFTRYLASVLSRYGIRANAISPGPFPYESTQRDDPEFMKRLGAKNPLGRIGQPYEMKAAAAFLCSDASSYVTGHNLAVDGGWTAW